LKIVADKKSLLELTLPDGGSFACSNIDDAYRFCQKIAKAHYENFPVGSVLIPQETRKYFYSVYSFARIADDIADELAFSDTEQRVQALQSFLAILTVDEDSHLTNPIAMALRDTMKAKDIPIAPFEKLIAAFISDIRFVQPATFYESLTYCANSANPIGELVLRLFGEYNQQTMLYSDAICTGLQLVNFWQDISVDVPKGRIYIPKDICDKYSLDFSDFPNNLDDKNFEKSLEEIYNFTNNFFLFGKNLINCLIAKRLKLEIAITLESGLKILEKLKNLEINVKHKRVTLNKGDFPTILYRAIRYHLL
jgi:squalene synthase HpnC